LILIFETQAITGFYTVELYVIIGDIQA